MEACPQTVQLPSHPHPTPPKKSCDHSDHSLLCLKIINILMHQIASQHISISKKFGPPRILLAFGHSFGHLNNLSPKRKILDRTLHVLNNKTPCRRSLGLRGICEWAAEWPMAMRRCCLLGNCVLCRLFR